MAEPKVLRFSQDDECKVDRFSLLSEEALVSILCFLPLKEATATRKLARRWRYLHTLTRKVDFDGTPLLDKLQSQRSGCSYGGFRMLVKEERCNYIKWVRKVLSKHKSPTVEEFRVFFTFDRSDSQTIDEWLRFAFSREVEKLELNFPFSVHYLNTERYCFPDHVVGTDEFTRLKELSINRVDVNGEFLKEVVRNCRLIQKLSISRSDIEYVEIIEPSPSFKSLDITKCCRLRSLMILDSNIVTLKVENSMKMTPVVLENVPLLDEFWCWPYADSFHATMESVHIMFSSLFSQLRVLKIYAICQKFKEEDWRNFCSGVEFSNLKQLVVVKGGGKWKQILHVINLINASPKLEIFELVMDDQEILELEIEEEEIFEIVMHEPEILELEIDEEDEDYFRKTMAVMARVKARSACRKIPKKYPCLKTVIIVGYHGLFEQFVMVMHLVANGVALQNIIVDPQAVDLLYQWYPYYDYIPQKEMQARSLWDYLPKRESSLEIIERAHELKNFVPPRVDLHFR